MDLFNVKEILYIVATLKEQDGIHYVESINTAVKLWYESIPAEIEDLLSAFIQYLRAKELLWICS